MIRAAARRMVFRTTAVRGEFRTAYGLEFDCPFTGRPLKFERPVGGSAMEFDQYCSGEPIRLTSVMS